MQLTTWGKLLTSLRHTCESSFHVCGRYIGINIHEHCALFRTGIVASVRVRYTVIIYINMTSYICYFFNGILPTQHVHDVYRCIIWVLWALSSVLSSLRVVRFIGPTRTTAEENMYPPIPINYDHINRDRVRTIVYKLQLEKYIKLRHTT